MRLVLLFIYSFINFLITATPYINLKIRPCPHFTAGTKMTARARGAGKKARNASFANWDYQRVDFKVMERGNV